MTIKEFELESKEEKPVIAICYDFDKTLSPDDMQAQGYIQSVGFDIRGFWKKSNGLAADNDMDQNLAYMFTMKEEAAGQVLFTKRELAKYGEQVKLFNGVEDWFERINAYGERQGVVIEHYIISSGLKEMIEGNPISRAFKKIYATSFYCNEKGEAVWPAQVVNYTNKTQFLFRISKGVLDVNDQRVNDAFAPEDIRVPFRNMVYIGDSDTDIPCMKLVNSHGGYSIGVYNPETNDKSKVYKMTSDNRIKYFAPADYSDQGELDNLIKLIIDRTTYNEQLEYKAIQYKEESLGEYGLIDKTKREKQNLINALESSRNFANTHSVIRKLSEYDTWSPDEIKSLITIAKENTQVHYILGDKDINRFYKKLLPHLDVSDEQYKWLKENIEIEESN